METVFRYRLDAADGVGARVAVWARAMADVALGATREWISLFMDLGRRGRGMTMGSMARDVRYALRGLRRSPGIATLAVITLALGIGASTATFSVVDGVMLEPLPYPEADRLVALWPETNSNASLVREFEERVPALDEVAGIAIWTGVLSGAGDPLELQVGRVTPGYFRILGIEPQLGRVLREEDAVPDDANSVILSHGLWQSRFGGDPDIVGRTVQLNLDQLRSHVVVGVMPAGFQPYRADVPAWTPIPVAAGTVAEDDSSWYVSWRIAKLAPGATVEQATAQVRALAPELRRRLPGFFDEDQVAAAGVTPIKDDLLEETSTALWVMLGAVGLVVLIACVNVANLLLIRGETRARDLALRVALGADRAGLVRLLLVETSVLAILGGVLGIAAATSLTDVIVRLAPASLPRIESVSVDGRVLGFALFLTMGATLLSGLWPALRASRPLPGVQMGGAGRGTVGRGGSRRLSRGLVALELALAVVVTLGSGLMLRSLGQLLSVDPGFDTQGVVAFRANPLGDRHSGGAAFNRFYREVVEELKTVPGVQTASGINILAGSPGNWSFPTYPQDVEVIEEDGAPTTNFRAVFGDYFETLRIPIVQGRPVTDADRQDTEPVIVVNQAFVAEHWPDEDPVGKSIAFFSRDAVRYRVVGVVGDVRQFSLGRAPVPEVYVSHAQWNWEIPAWLVVRTIRPDVLKAQLRSVVDRVDPASPIAGVDDLQTVIGRSAGQTRFLALLLSSFGVLALLLGAVGVYGVTAYSVAQRVPEFGVRIALGAQRSEIVGHAARSGAIPVLTGLVGGLALALASGRLLRSYLYQIEPGDPLTVALTVGVLTVVGTCALVLPARRAGRVDPVEALSAE